MSVIAIIPDGDDETVDVVARERVWLWKGHYVRQIVFFPGLEIDQGVRMMVLSGAKRTLACIPPEPVKIVLQTEALQGDELCMGRPYITKVLGFVGDAGNGFLASGVTLDKPILWCQRAKTLADACVGKGGTDGIDGWLSQRQIDGETGFVFACARKRNKLTGKDRTIVAQ